MTANLILWLLHRLYKKAKRKDKRHVIYFIKGIEEDYPKYLLYTEDPNIYQRMEEF